MSVIEDWMSSLQPLLFDASVRGAAVLLAALIAIIFMRRASAAARHLIWASALAISLLLPIASALLPTYRIALLPAAPVRTDSWKSSGALPHAPQLDEFSSDESLNSPVPRDRTPPLIATQSAALAAPISVASPKGEAPKAGLRISAVLVTVYLLCTATLIGWWSIGLIAAWRLIRRSPVVRSGRLFDTAASIRAQLKIRDPVELRLGSGILMPLTSGVLRPRVLLPIDATDWPADLLRSVLLHELAHVKRLDCFTQSLAQLACASYWFNPLMWIAAAHLRIERERACDDMVILHGTAADSYAQHLLDVAQAVQGQSFFSGGALAMAQPCGLRRRLVDILDQTNLNRRSLSRRLVFFAILVALAVLVPLSSIQLSARQATASAPLIAANKPQVSPTTSPAVPSVSHVGLPETTQSSGPLELTVLDQSTDKPLAGVKITINGEPANFHTTTDNDGHATIDFSKSRVPELSLQYPKYVQKMLTWRGAKQNEQPPATYVIHLVPGVTIGGKVIDDAGQAISGATVLLDVRAGVMPDAHERVMVYGRSVKTKPDGSWTFDGIPAMSKSINVGVWDYRYVNEDAGAGFFPMPAYQAPADLLNQHATLTLHRGVAVTGTVMGPDGEPVEGAMVGFGSDRVATNTVPSFKTKDDGRFAFTFKAGTNVVLTATAPGDAPELIQFTLGTETKDVTLQLQSGHAIQGRVSDSSGKPVARAYVWIDTWRGNRTLAGTTLRTDQNGQFKWNEAPSDAVYADIEAEGFMRQNKVALTAGATNNVSLDRPLHVSGTVSDAATGKPISSFKLVPGISFDAHQPTHFEQRSSRPEHDGSFDYTLTYPYPGYAVRVEAQGYLPADSRVFTTVEHEVHLDLKLQAAADWKPTLLLPSGEPAAGATATLALIGQSPLRFDGKLIPKYEDQDHPHFVAAADGMLDIPPEPSLAKLFVIDQAGYATADQDALKQNEKIQLQAWGQIHGRLMIGAHPAAGQTVAVNEGSRAATRPDDPQLFFDLQSTTDADGRFSFDHIPPGKWFVARESHQPIGNGFTNNYSQRRNFDLLPGQSIEVNVGGMGRPVVGSVQIPPELVGRTDWNWSFDCRLMTSDDSAEPPIPDEVKSGTPEVRRAWYARFLETDAGKAFVTRRRAAMLAMQQYPLEVTADGKFRVDDVSAGTYGIFVAITSPTDGTHARADQVLARGSASVTVAPMPTGRDDAPLEVPPLHLEMVKAAKP